MRALYGITSTEVCGYSSSSTNTADNTALNICSTTVSIITNGTSIF